MSSVVTMNDSPSDLVDWLHSVGIWWNDSLVQIRGGCSNCSGPALGVFSVKDIQENDLLCVIPRAAILSPRTTQLAQILEAEKLGGGLALTIAVMFEASLGKASKWGGYFASLPVREYLPMFWSDEELQLLAGTALDGVVQEDRQDTAEDYKQHVVPLMDKYTNAFPNPNLCRLEHFRRAASWVASRSFHVDNWHGDAMVPLADIFNHKASLVLLGDSWQVAEELDSHHHRQQQQPGRRQQQQRGHSEAQAPTNGLPADKAERVQELDGESAQNAEGDPEDSGAEDQQPDPDQDKDQSASEGSNDSLEGDESQEGEQSDHSKEQSDHSEEEVEEEEDSSEDDSEDDADDPQHGFAVGGMPMIAAAAGGATAAGGIVHKSAGCWVRDGVNLRLEIGICSMGEPDATLAAAAAEVNEHLNQHRHDHAHSDHCGCAHDEGRAEDKHESQGQCQKRVAEEPHQEQQRAKKQKTEQQQPKQQHFPDKRLEIVAASPVASGAEVHNTYGELSNHVLVHKYGFCLPANPFDEVQLGHSWHWLLQDVVKAAGLNKQLKHHIKWLQDHSNLLADNVAEDEEAEDPPAVAPGGRLPLLVAAVLRLLGLPASKLKTLDNLQELLEPPAQQDQQAADHKQQQKEAKNRKEGSTNQSADQDATVTTAAGGADDDEVALAEHFQDMQITSRNLAWWGAAGLHVLQEAVQQRLQQYPSKGLSIAEDEQTLQQWRSQQQRQQQQQETASKQEGEQPGVAPGDGLATGPHNPGEHAAAVAAAVQLRICEQRILKQALDAVQQVLGSNQV